MRFGARLAMALTTTVLVASVLPGAAPALARTGEPFGAAAAPKKVDYPGDGVDVWRKSGRERLLRGTPRAFKRFVTDRLDLLFDGVGRRSKCARSPLVTVRRYHRAGFASFSEGVYRACPNGGYAGIYVRGDDGWSAPITGQESPYCADLAWYDVPRFIADRQCYTERGDAADYRPGRSARVSPPAVARRLVSAATGIVIVETDQLAAPDVVAAVETLVEEGAFLSVVQCVDADDGSSASDFLGDAPFGCVLRASFDDNTYAEDRMLRMFGDASTSIIVGSVVDMGST